MTDASSGAGGGVFISYRRSDTAYAAGWLYDRLEMRFGPEKVFKDVDSIELGDDFVEVITAAVGSCDVLLALIGDEWLELTGDDSGRRIDDPDDFVRLEIEAALSRDVRVIPVLVDSAAMPEAKDLPSSLAQLARRQALELSPTRFDFDVGRLLAVLERTLLETQAHRALRATASPAALNLWTERDPSHPVLDPTADVVRQAVSELSLPDGGNGFVVVQREDAQRYAQAARTSLDDYMVEYRGGDPARHFAVAHLSLATAQSALCGWAFNAPGWRIRYPWTRLRTGSLERGETSGTVRPRDSEGRWRPTVRHHEPLAPERGPRRPRRSPSVSSRPTTTGPAGMPRRGARTWLAVGVGGALVVGLLVFANDWTPGGGSDGSSSEQSDTDTMVFVDDFTDRGGWEGDAEGRYQDGAYRFDLDANGSPLAYPGGSSRVYPLAPQNVRVIADVRSQVPLSDKTGFGVICRLDVAARSGYTFTLRAGTVNIDKIGINGGAVELKSTSIPETDITAFNEIAAECSTDEAGRVHLTFLLNGKAVAQETDDSEDRWQSGTVGIHASTFDATPVRAEFDNFRVQVINEAT